MNLQRVGRRKEDDPGELVYVSSWWSANGEKIWRLLMFIFMGLSVWMLNSIVDLKTNAVCRTELTYCLDKIDRKLDRINSYLLENNVVSRESAAKKGN